MDKLMSVLMSIEWWNKERRPLVWTVSLNLPIWFTLPMQCMVAHDISAYLWFLIATYLLLHTIGLWELHSVIMQLNLIMKISKRWNENFSEVALKFSCFYRFQNIFCQFQSFFNFSRMFLNLNDFSIWIPIVLIKSPGISLKSILLPKIVLTFHCLNISSDLKKFANSRPSASNLKNFFSITSTIFSHNRSELPYARHHRPLSIWSRSRL